MRTFFITSALLFAIAGQVMGAPVKMPMPLAREIGSVETVNAYVRRNGLSVEKSVDERRSVAVEVASIEPYEKRSSVRVEVASKAPNGEIEPYNKRSSVAVETASKAPDGIIEPYEKRSSVRVEVASKAPNGEIEPYN